MSTIHYEVRDKRLFGWVSYDSELYTYSIDFERDNINQNIYKYILLYVRVDVIEMVDEKTTKDELKAGIKNLTKLELRCSRNVEGTYIGKIGNFTYIFSKIDKHNQDMKTQKKWQYMVTSEEGGFLEGDSYTLKEAKKKALKVKML